MLTKGICSPLSHLRVYCAFVFQGGFDSAIKKIYHINVDAESLEDGSTLEKTLVLDVADPIKTTGAPLYEKLEGIAYSPEGDVWLSVDNDGVSEVPGETQLWNLGKIYETPATSSNSAAILETTIMAAVTVACVMMLL